MTNTPHTISIRPAYPDDAGTIRRLAALDSATTPAGPLLVAEVAGELRAALSLRDGKVIADPFQPTAHPVVMLRVHAAEHGARRTASPARLAAGVFRALTARHAGPSTPQPRRVARPGLSLNAWALLGAR